MALNSLFPIRSTARSRQPAKNKCALCQQAVEIKGFFLVEENAETRHFCCEGCLSIYRLFNKNASRSNS